MKCMNACMKGGLALLIFMMGSFEDINMPLYYLWEIKGSR